MTGTVGRGTLGSSERNKLPYITYARKQRATVLTENSIENCPTMDPIYGKMVSLVGNFCSFSSSKLKRGVFRQFADDTYF